MTTYMFDPAIPLFVRGLSPFHGWLPFLLLWLVARLGYDRRAFGAQTVLGIAVLLVCYFWRRISSSGRSPECRREYQLRLWIE